MFNHNKKDHLIFLIVAVSFITSALVGFFAGGASYELSNRLNGVEELMESLQKEPEEDSESLHPFQDVPKVTYQDKIVKAVEKSSPSVVSIIITKDLPVLERYQSDNDFFPFQVPQYRQEGTEKQEIGGGTGFVVDKKGYILTNRHVVNDSEAEYTVLTNDGEKLDAKVLARHPARDLAVLKVDQELPALTLADSAELKLGQTAIAIGNALGEFKNTVSTGVVSGLDREITAQGAGRIEHLDQLIQTDAAINQGNSGGPLLDLKGEVVGINIAMAQTAENIGFAIPINQAKASIDQVKKEGKITIPFLGVRYLTIDETLAQQNNLPVEHGALILSGEQSGQVAVVPGSPADKAGLRENDIILSIDGEKITPENSLGDIIITKEIGQKVELEYYSKGETKKTTVELDER